MIHAQEDLGILHFVRKYKHCEECQGWDERYEGVQPPSLNMSGTIMETVTRPAGVTLSGRTNHRRSCTKRTVSA